MTIQNRIALARSTWYCWGLIGALALSGCNFPTAPTVTVTIKSAGGEEEAAADEEAGDDGAVEGYGSVTGQVLFDGTPPNLASLVNQGDSAVKDASVCSAETIPDETLEVDAATKGIGNVVVYLAKPPKHIKPELSSGDAEPAIFDQKGCRFKPHILPVRVDLNQPLLVMSEDSIAHNTHTNPKRNSQFNQAIKANDRDGVPVKYTRAESEPIPVTCDYHSWMKAYHFPIDHPYYAITNPDGTFTIDGLPAGTHQFVVWQERAGILERKLEVTVAPDEATTVEPSKTTYGADKFGL